MSWRSTAPASTEVPTSRALNIDADRTAIEAACTKRSIEISAIEPLLSGGTRVVLVNSDGAAKLRTAFKSKLLVGPTTRTRWVANR